MDWIGPALREASPWGVMALVVLAAILLIQRWPRRNGGGRFQGVDPIQKAATISEVLIDHLEESMRVVREINNLSQQTAREVKAMHDLITTPDVQVSLRMAMTDMHEMMKTMQAFIQHTQALLPITPHVPQPKT